MDIHTVSQDTEAKGRPQVSPPLTVAILNWNGATLLQKFLPSVVEYTPSHHAKILVIDNGSTDHSLQLLREEFPEVEVLALEENLGFAGGYNEVMKRIETPYACLLNSDVQVSKDWIESPLRMLQENSSLAAVQPKILSYKKPICYEYAGAAGGFLDRHGYPFCRGRIFATVEEDHGQYDKPTAIMWASGAALFVRKEAFLAVGGFDTLFFSHMEEIDLAWRFHRKGYNVFYDPTSKVYHVGGATLPSSSPQKTYYNYRNNLLMLYKNLPYERSGRLLRTRKWLDLIAALPLLLSGKWGHYKAQRKAWRDFRKMKSYYEPPLNVSSDEVLCPFSIVVQYFLWGRRYFSQLPRALFPLQQSTKKEIK